VQSCHTKRGEIKEIIIKNTSLAYYNYDTFYSGYGKNSKKNSSKCQTNYGEKLEIFLCGKM